MNYIKLICHLKNEDIEWVSDYLFSLGCLGTELVESDFINTILEDKFGEIYTLNNHDYPDRGIIIKGYFDINIDINELYIKINLFLKENKIEPINQLFQIETLEEMDYSTSWKDDYQEVIINDQVSIIPSWFTSNSDKIYVKIEPGLGFGTGSHPTTFMCLKHATEYIKWGDAVCDLGTGSGVIAILAKKLGANEVYGIDLDEEALKNARYNAKLNNQVDLVFTNKPITELQLKLDVIIANLVFNVILELLPDIKACLKENGFFILSGITNTQKDDIMNELVDNKFQLIKVDEQKDFVSFVYRK